MLSNGVTLQFPSILMYLAVGSHSTPHIFLTYLKPEGIHSSMYVYVMAEYVVSVCSSIDNIDS